MENTINPVHIDFGNFRELLKRDRSVRRFIESDKIDYDIIENLVSLTRYCASGRNAQPLRYIIVSDGEECARLFPNLQWAGYYSDWAGPAEGERPVAYLIQCLDTEVSKNCLCDDGLQLQAITLGATTLGLGCCIIKAFNKQGVMEALNIPKRYDPLYVLAIGRPGEKVKIVDMKEDGDFKYYRNSEDEQCVPKRSPEDLIINCKITATRNIDAISHPTDE